MSQEMSTDNLNKLFLHVQKEFLTHISQNQIENEKDHLNKIFQRILKKSLKDFKLTEFPSKSTLYKSYQHLLSTNKIREDFITSSVLMTNSIRSQSGVLPISVALDGRISSCSYNCSYCPNETIKNGATVDMARSYLSSEGTFIRGAIQDFNIVKQIWRRLAEVESMGHPPDKLEFIALGGTFDCFPKDYRLLFSLSIFYACNMYAKISIRFKGTHKYLLEDYLKLNPFLNSLPLSDEIFHTLNSLRPMPDLTGKNQYECFKIINDEQMLNTKSACARVIGLVLETRPDHINKYTMLEMRAQGCTRIQIGIQSTNDYVLSLNKRGHGVKESIKAIEHARDNCYKVDGHLMPDLPGTTLEIDYETVKDVFLNSTLQLDYCKIYPCLDLPFTEIRKWKLEKEWTPIAETDFKNFLQFLVYTMSIVPPWTRINRVQRDFPVASIKNNHLGYVSDTIKTNLQQVVTLEMEQQGLKCYDIRTREIRGLIIDDTLNEASLFIRIYRTLNGTEFFISVEIPNDDLNLNLKLKSNFNFKFNNCKLLGLCRLRIPDFEFSKKEDCKSPSHYLPTFRQFNRIARIRELHVYGTIASTSIRGNSQHKGVGKFLMGVAENISRSFKCDMVAVISGVGVRNYYETLNYTLNDKTDKFMTKNIGFKFEPMMLFKKNYDYETIHNHILNSIIVKKYIRPLTDDLDLSGLVKGNLNLKVTRHIYTNIQSGEAEGFAFFKLDDTDSIRTAIILIAVLILYVIVCCLLI